MFNEFISKEQFTAGARSHTSSIYTLEKVIYSFKDQSIKMDLKLNLCKDSSGFKANSHYCKFSDADITKFSGGHQMKFYKYRYAITIRRNGIVTFDRLIFNKNDLGLEGKDYEYGHLVSNMSKESFG